MKLSGAITCINDGNLVIQILFGVFAGIAFGFFLHTYSMDVPIVILELLGSLFVGALKAIAPIVVFVLICESIATKEFTNDSQKGLRKIIVLYVVGTFAASICAVIAWYISPVTLILQSPLNDLSNAPTSISKVLVNLVLKAVDNPVNALASGNFIALIVWAVCFGVVFRHARNTTKDMIIDISAAVSKVVKFVIRLAPIGIFGLVATSVISTGFVAISSYLKLVVVLVACMLFVAFVINAIIVFLVTKKNPYPLIFTCIKESAVTAFFTRSSVANIPVNIALAKNLNIDESLYSVSIPLGATINAGAAITIAILALATANTLNIQIDFLTTIFLCFIASIAACGASGVAGGSLMLVPLACSLFGISNDIAMQVVAIGFIIGVIQDSFETALNSSNDVLFTAAVWQSLEEK